MKKLLSLALIVLTLPISTACDDKSDSSLEISDIEKENIELIYDDAEISADLMNSVTDFFYSIQTSDYSNYEQSLHPEYFDRIVSFLTENYGYGLEDSFELQVSNLIGTVEGAYQIKSIEASIAETDSSVEYLQYLDEIFGEEDNAFSSSVIDNSDEIYDIVLTVNVIREDEAEIIMLEGTEIFFTLTDGEYYTFG